ncbi:MAG: hypothetical protein MK179_19555, partial [Pirellulaceae bacterium]|nr:hypothetical protein [Pirellulaceae bacterium]
MGIVTSNSKDNTYLIETAGDLYLNTVGTGASATAFITVPGGSIFNGHPNPATGSNVSSGMTYLIAAQN